MIGFADNICFKIIFMNLVRCLQNNLDFRWPLQEYVKKKYFFCPLYKSYLQILHV